MVVFGNNFDGVTSLEPESLANGAGNGNLITFGEGSDGHERYLYFES